MAITNFQYVTLVAAGGTPVRLADQNGANIPTTGQGSLVFSDGATLTNVTINGIVNPSPLGVGNGTVAAPALYFGTADRGLYSRGSGDISFASNGSRLASITTDATELRFTTTSTELKLFSDTNNEVAIQGYDNAGVVVKQLSLQKYGANVFVGPGLAAQAAGSGNVSIYGGLAVGYSTVPAAGGDFFNRVSIGAAGVALYAAVSAPTVVAGRGSLAMRSDAGVAGSPGVPYYAVDSAGTWDQVVGRTATQTLTNKTFTSPTLNNPNITGTVTGNASYTAITLTNPVITGTASVTGGTLIANTPGISLTQTWNNAAVNFTAFLINATKTTEAGSSRLLSVQLGGADRFYVDQFGAGIFNSGGFFGGNMNVETGGAIPAGGTQDFGINWSTTAHFGLYFGSGVPTSSQARGSLYLRSDGLPYYNTNGTTGWDRLAGLSAANDFTAGSVNVTTQAIGTNSTLAASCAYADRAGLANLIIKVTVVTSSGTWTTDTNMVYATLECWGAGGGGGGTAPAGVSSSQTGGGGGAGSYSRKTVSKATAGTTQTTTIGAAGAAGTAGNNAGGAGGDTSVGILCIGKGGAGGPGNPGGVVAGVAGGAGGVAGTGDITSTGDPGGPGMGSSAGTVISAGGWGGSSLVGGGALAVAGASAGGNAGTGHASGGGGGWDVGGGANRAGGLGTSGYIVITEFLKA